MAKSILIPFLPVILTLLYLSGETESTATATSFIKTKCGATTYPSLCVQSLSIYARTIQKSQRQLAQTALSVSLQRAQINKSFVKKLTKFKRLKPIEYAAIKDCLEEMTDTVETLSKSLNELKSIGKARGPDFIWHMNNIQTWVSAALTDGTTCADGFSGRNMNVRIKTSLNKRVTGMAQVTSNALALVNQYAATS